LLNLQLADFARLVSTGFSWSGFSLIQRGLARFSGQLSGVGLVGPGRSRNEPPADGSGTGSFSFRRFCRVIRAAAAPAATPEAEATLQPGDAGQTPENDMEDTMQGTPTLYW